MSEPIMDISIECFQTSKSKTGSTIVFARDVQQTAKGPGAKDAVTFQISEQAAANLFDVGCSYSIVISKIKISENG
jgi:hypothetical protein